MQKVTKHPLLWPAIALSAGITFGSLSEVEWHVGFIASALCLIAAFRWRWVLLAGLFFFGASLFCFRFDANDPIDLRRQFSSEPQLVILRGVLDGDPERRVLTQDQRTRYRTTARVAVSEVEWRGIWKPATGEVAVTTTGFLEDSFVSGAAVEVAGVLEKPNGPLAPGMFDFARYLKWQRIFFSLRAEGTNDWKLTRQAQGWSSAALYRKFNNWAMRTLQRGIPADENTRLLWAMTLGWRPGLTNDVSEPFMRTGTLHIFAQIYHKSPATKKPRICGAF